MALYKCYAFLKTHILRSDVRLIYFREAQSTFGPRSLAVSGWNALLVSFHVSAMALAQYSATDLINITVSP